MGGGVGWLKALADMSTKTVIFLDGSPAYRALKLVFTMRGVSEFCAQYIHLGHLKGHVGM